MITEEHDLIVSQLVLDEFESVLRKKFKATKTSLARAFMLVDEAEVIPDGPTPDRSGYHPTNDTRILLTASAGHVDLVVTGDRGMQAQANEFGIQAVSPRGLLELMSQADDAYPAASADDQDNLVSEPKENPIKDKSFEFSLKIIRLYQRLQDQKEYVLSKQLLRSGTSIGANVEEATAAESRKDFIHKMKIAMKESRETNYWLRLLDQSKLTKEIDLNDLLRQSDEISRMLTSITKTAIENSRR